MDIDTNFTSSFKHAFAFLTSLTTVMSIEKLKILISKVNN